MIVYFERVCWSGSQPGWFWWRYYLRRWRYTHFCYIYMCVCFLVSGMCSLSYYKVVRIFQPGFLLRQRLLQSYSWGARAHYLSPTTRYSCQWQETISYTAYSTTDMDTADNKQRKYKEGTNSWAYGTFSYLYCDTRDIVLPWYNTLRIDHYTVAWESATKRGPNTYILPLHIFSGLLKCRF